MRYSKLLGKTLRQASKTVQGSGITHLLRAGMIRSSSPGAYTFLPLGARVMGKYCALIERQLAKAGAQAIIASPYAPTFKEQSSVAEMKRELAECRREARFEYYLAASHEETLATLTDALNVSYRELPLVLAQQQWKYGDSGRWFLMQDAYVLKAADDGVNLANVCRAVFQASGVDVLSLETAAGVEFGVFSEAGADDLAYCESCNYAALWDAAESQVPVFDQAETPQPVEEIFGPGMISVAQIAGFAQLPQQKITKALLFVANGRNVAVCIRGDFDVSERKLRRFLHCSSLELSAPELVRELTGAEVGYAGPIGLRNDVEVIWDVSTAGRSNFEAGANKTGHHLLNLNFGRDLPMPERFADVRQVFEGERCNRCAAGRIQRRRGDRVGHASSLGEIYAKPLGAMYGAREGGSRPLRIDCCGLDLSRLFFSVAEQNADGRGFKWTAALAPFQVHLISLGGSEDRGEEIYRRLSQAGVEVLWDDRQSPAGAKFGDADLIGIPLRLVVSPRTGEQVEWKERSAEHAVLKSLDEVIDGVRLLLRPAPPES